MDGILSYSGLLPRQSPPPPNDNGSLLDSSGKKAGAALAIALGVLFIVFASYMCCCRHCSKRTPRHTPTSYHSKDLERAAEHPALTYEMEPQHQQYAYPQQPAPVQLPTYTGNTEAEIQADGRVPADQVFPSKDVHDPPPEYPGSPMQRPAELAVRR